MAKTLSNKKKIIVMSALVLLLAVTAVFNFVLADTSANVNANEPVTAANYFAAYRSEPTTRNEELTQLDGVIALYQPGDAKYEEATKMKMEIVAAMEKELVVETMVKAIGFSDAVVTVSSDFDSVNVFIDTPELTYDSALSIYTTLKNETGISPEKIRIVPINSAD